ncbi:hypothetical protein [Pectobacterium carotovorum]|uniref:hypothetical protein n=1 Tax=Pectobacterium carotovorum TaxID=554 RepID=UPI0021760ABC|nr:hypothetical protein [Pectobacterium carotovorum]
MLTLGFNKAVRNGFCHFVLTSNNPLKLYFRKYRISLLFTWLCQCYCLSRRGKIGGRILLVGAEAADAAGKHFERVFQRHNPTEEDHLSLIVDGQAPLALINFCSQALAENESL